MTQFPRFLSVKLTSRTVYCFALIQLFLTLPSGGLGAFANIIIKSFGFTTWQTQLLQMVSGVIQITAMLSAVWVDKRFHQTIWAMIASVIPTIAGTIVLIIVPFEPSKRVGLLFAYYIMISFWACSGLVLSLLTRNVAGQTKKSVVIAINFVFWATGNAIGPQTFRAQNAPRYFLALAIILGCFCLLVLTLFVLRTYYVWQNKRRDGKIARGEAVADELYTHSFEDLTDRVSFLSINSLGSIVLILCNIEKRQLQIYLLGRDLLREMPPGSCWRRGSDEGSQKNAYENVAVIKGRCSVSSSILDIVYPNS